MIITSKLIWMHLPKTAGTTTEKLFVASGLPLLWNDSQSSPLKHLPELQHPSRDKLPICDQLRTANFRRLPYWLISNYQHKLKMMGLSVDPSQMKKGLFWRDRDQSWLPADWWLNRLQIDESTILLRIDHLKLDFLSLLNLYQPISCYSRYRVRFVRARNKNSYSRRLSDWFTPTELSNAYKANPFWAALERRVYGSLMVDP